MIHLLETFHNLLIHIINNFVEVPASEVESEVIYILKKLGVDKNEKKKIKELCELCLKRFQLESNSNLVNNAWRHKYEKVKV